MSCNEASRTTLGSVTSLSLFLPEISLGCLLRFAVCPRGSSPPPLVGAGPESRPSRHLVMRQESRAAHLCVGSQQQLGEFVGCVAGVPSKPFLFKSLQTILF